MPTLAEAVAAAKLWLISAGTADLPYLSQGLFALVTVPSAAVERVSADDRWRLYVNPDWAACAPVEALAREIAHQAWHLLLDHAGRAQAMRVDAASASAWRAAADLAVHEVLAAAGVAPEGLAEEARLLRPAGRGLEGGRSAEEYFVALCGHSAPEDGGDGPEADDGSAGSGDADGSASDGVHRPWELADQAGGLTGDAADGVRRAVAAAFLADRMARPGEAAGEAERWARRLLDPRIPWERLLAQAARRGIGWTSGRSDTTYTRPNRRASSVPGVLLPGWRRRAPAVACVVDTSGSVDEGLLGRALDEVEGALRALGVASDGVTVLTCDASVQAVRRVRRAADAALVGGGGTDLRAALAEVERLRPRPTLTMVFTDGQTPWPNSPPPGSAVVIALLLRPEEEAPPTPGWASVVECRLDG